MLETAHETTVAGGAAPRRRCAAPVALRVGLLVEPRYLAQREPAAAAHALRARGCAVTVAAASGRSARRLAGSDVVLARGRSAALLDALAAVEAGGTPVLNRPAAIAGVVDKAAMAERLAAAGVPSPETLAVAGRDLDAAIARLGLPVVVKPVDGDNGRDVFVLRTAADVAALAWTAPRALVQRFVPSRGVDLKLYVAGASVWAVEKASPLAPDAGPARPVPLVPAARALALRCAAVFGLDLLGVDCVEGPDGLAVIEVNDFPNYSAVPAADDAIAALVLDHGRGAQHGSTR